MNYKVLFVIVFFNITLQLIKFDSGDYVHFDQFSDNMICQNNAVYTKTISFSGTFANVPQLMFFPYRYDTTSGTTQFTFTPESITTTSYNVKITCKNSRVTCIWFRWAAIDDYRVEVINSFNNDMTNQASQTYTFSHSNSNVVQGFVSYINFGYNGNMNFQLAIQSITTNSVTVSFTTNTANLIYLGYQIILGTSEAFVQSSLVIKTSLSLNSYYDSGTLTLPTGYTLLLPQSAIIFTNNDNITQNSTYTQTGQTFSYQKGGWFTSILNSLSWREIQFNFQILQPMLYHKLRISETFSCDIAQPIQLAISELNQIYTSATALQVQIDQSIQTVNFILTFQCLEGKKIQGQILKSASYTQLKQQWQQNCYGSINQIAHYITLNQKDNVIQTISLTITSSNVLVTQSVVNQVIPTTYTLIDVSIVPQ